MLDTFKARLKAKSKALGANLSQKRIDALADRLHKKNPDLTEEADHDERIDDLNDLTPLKDIAKTDDQLRTLSAKPKPKSAPEEVEDEEEEETEDEPVQNKKKPKVKKEEEMPAWAKALSDQVTALSKEKTATSMQAKLAEKLKDKGIPASYYKRIALPEKEEELDDFATQLETDYTEFKQEQINAGLMTATPPVTGDFKGSQATTKVLDDSIKAWADSKKESTTEKAK
jgi:hypothetical protein